MLYLKFTFLAFLVLEVLYQQIVVKEAANAESCIALEPSCQITSESNRCHCWFVGTTEILLKLDQNKACGSKSQTNKPRKALGSCWLPKRSWLEYDGHKGCNPTKRRKGNKTKYHTCYKLPGNQPKNNLDQKLIPHPEDVHKRSPSDDIEEPSPHANGVFIHV